MKYLPHMLTLLLATSAHATARVDIELNNYTCLQGQYCTLTAKYYNHLTNDTNKDQDYCVDLSLCVDGFGCGKPFHQCGVRVLPHDNRLIGKEISFNRTYDWGAQCFQINANARVTSNDGTNVTETSHKQLCIWNYK